MIIGFLAPTGKLYSCFSYGHMDLARNMCKKLYDKEYMSVEAEDYLLKQGFIVIRGRDAYKTTFDDGGNIIAITKQQLDFFEEHLCEFNNMQASDITKMIEEDKDWNGIIAKQEK